MQIRDKTMLKRQRSTVESLPHDVVELILERLPLNRLHRFKSVSKKWNSTIESSYFKERQLKRRMQSRGPDILYLIKEYLEDENRTSVLWPSTIIHTLKLPSSKFRVCHGSCDGLVCLFCNDTTNIVLNPATGWHQSFPLSYVQNILSMISTSNIRGPSPRLGFGKDKFTGTYKPVWLYNSYEFGLGKEDSTTTCEVFDFSVNAWRYVVSPASSYRILDQQKPVYLDGSLYWFTECEETKVLSFDLHKETFQVICKTPFTSMPSSNRRHYDVIMSVLDNCLCVSEKNGTTQVIWLLDSSSTWKILCSIDLFKTFGLQSRHYAALLIAILENKKLLLGRGSYEKLVIHDLHTKSYDLVYSPYVVGYPVCYFQSLFSVSSN